MKTIYWFFIFLISIRVSGQQVHRYTTYMDNPAIGASMVLTDPVYNNPLERERVDRTISVKNIVTFEMIEVPNASYYANGFTCTAKIKIEKESWNGPSPEEPEVSLIINYDPQNATNKVAAYYKFEGSHKVKITINDIAFGNGVQPYPIFRLRQEMVIERQFKFDPLVNPLKPTVLQETDKLRLSVDPTEYPGAEEFDVEYAFVDDYSEVANKIVSDPLAVFQENFLSDLFRHDATRITLSGGSSSSVLSYDINSVYPDGYIFYRVRGVQYNDRGLRVEGIWSYKKAGTSSYFYERLANPLGKSYNWQYSAAFAEEGKKKEAVSYFDGSLKSRQTVTLSNTDNASIVQENVYDAMGRVALNVLPAPTTTNNLKFQPIVNLSSGGQQYGYGGLNIVKGYLSPNPISTSAGASAYYSGTNPFKSQNPNVFGRIPDAEGFPFSATQYTNDLTGRIKAQGGVGKAFQPAKDPQSEISGKATRYFYSKPSQKELFRLFGKEAGKASHYLKNLVIDPNGQASYSYINASGKTIATSLAGDTTFNIFALESSKAPEAQYVLNEDLVDPSSLVIDRNNYRINFSTSFLVAKPGNYLLVAAINPWRLETTHGPNNELKICNDCYYNLEVKVTDDNGDPVITEKKSTITPMYNEDCSVSQNSVTANASFHASEPGKYNVEYSVQVNKYAVDKYWETFKETNTNIKKLEQFKREYIQEVDYSGCFADCRSCELALGTFDEFKAAIQTTFSEEGVTFGSADESWALSIYNDIKQKCQLLLPCPQTNACDVLLNRIMLDVRPGGQYALFDENRNLLEPEINVLDLTKRTGLSFVDEEGNPAWVVLDDGSKVTPAQLSNADFIDRFEASWALALAPLHPEYCYYQYCVQHNSASEAFDQRLMTEIGTYEQAKAAHLFFDEGLTRLVDADPLFADCKNAEYKDEIVNKLTNFYTDPLTYTSKSVVDFIHFLAYCAMEPNLVDNCPPVSEICRNKDVEWTMYKAIYLSLKQSVEDKIMKATPGFENCNNCNIGKEIEEVAYATMSLKSLVNTVGSDPAFSSLQLNSEVIESIGKEKKVKGRKGFRSYPFRIVPEKKLKKLPKKLDAFVKFYTKFNAIVFDNGEPVKLEYDSVYVLNLPKELDSATKESIDRYVMYDENDEAPVINETLVFTPMSVQCGPVVGWVTDYSRGAREFYVTCEGTYNVPPNAINCAYYDFYQIANSTFEWQSYNGVYVCEKATSASCATGYYISSNNQFLYINTSNIAPDDYSNGVFHASYTLTKPDGTTCNFSNVYVFTKTANSSCNQTITGVATVGCDGNANYTQVSVHLPEAASSYVSATIQVFGTPIGSSTVELIGSQRVTFLAYSTSTYFCLPFNYSKYSNIQIKAGSMACNSCNEGVYLFNGKQVQISFDGNAAVTKDFGNCNFYSSITVTKEGGGTCNFSNVRVCERVKEPCLGASEVQLLKGTLTPYRQWDLLCSGAYAHYYSGKANMIVRVPDHDTRLTVSLQLNSVLASDKYCASEDHNTHPLTLIFEPGVNELITPDYEVSYFPATNEYILDGDAISVACEQLPDCPPIPNGELYASKIRRFGHNAGKVPTLPFGGSAVKMKEYGDQRIKKKQEEQCESNADWWMAKLENCVILKDDPTKYTLLRQALIDICSNSVDADHLEPSRNVPAGISITYTSFREAIVGILGQAAIKELCNDLLIETPFPYEQQPKTPVSMPVIMLSQLPASLKANISRWKSEYTASPQGYATLLEYIKAKGTIDPYFHQDGKKYLIGNYFSLKEKDLQLILSSMENNCLYVSKTVTIPPALQANSCITLADIRIAETEFKGAYPYMGILDENYYTLLTTFINHKFAGNYSAHKVQQMVESNNQDGLLCVENLREESPVPTAYDCMKEQMKFAVMRAINDYEVYIEQERLIFYKRYTDKCMSVLPSLILSGNVKEYHYTLYYYDQSGNLVKTVPPAGVVLLGEDQISTLMTNPLADISNMHLMATVYKYNSLNQVVWQSSPDGGQTEFWYDRLGRLFASRNAVQKQTHAYSYTMYDELGRIKEVGEKTGSGTEFASSDQALHGSSFPDLVIRKHDDNSIDRYEANNSIVFEEGFDTGADPYVVAEIITPPDDEENLRRFYASGENNQVTRTLYADASNLPIQQGLQENLRSRVSMSEYLERVSSQLTRRSASHYSYDVAGNVKTLWQENTEWGELSSTNQFKKLQYKYDLISGKVNEVWYQQGKTDAFAHRYLYDGENRLTGAYTSRDGFVWKKEAGYQYFLHGPLQRIELGGDANDKRIVQGIDYTYTLQGWLKAINGVRLGEANDPGRDGSAGSTIPKDVLAYTIGYFKGDYKSIDPMPQWNLQYQFTPDHPIGAGLYNGNIGYTTIERSHDQGKVMGYSYGYDQLNRLKEFRSNNIIAGVTQWSTDKNSLPFAETVTYDGNGNIRTYLRNSENGNVMDSLTYSYYDLNTNGSKVEYTLNQPNDELLERTNQLARVADAAGTHNGLGDLDDQTRNYEYDKIGNLTSDRDQAITGITWNVYGKIMSIQNSKYIRYRYDPSGNRISKAIFDGQQDTTKSEKGKRTVYVRDAQGNTMAIYEKEPGLTDWTLSELHLYGSSRLGTYKPNIASTTVGLNTGVGHDGYLAGTREYELSNHLGNVLVTVSDKKIGHSSNGTIDYYEADVVSAQDYYPFGMIMKERAKNNSGRYGFNGHQKDDEVKGEGNHYSFGDYGYDPRLGRRWQIDPVEQHDISPYIVFNNNPNYFVDPDGESPISLLVKMAAKAGLKKAAKELVENQIKKRLTAYMSKSWAKQLGKDALDAIDLATSQSWWEYGVELIPWVGDAYSAGKFTKQQYHVWKAVQRFESIAEWAGKAAGKAWERLGPNNLVGKGADKVADFTKKFNSQGDHLGESDLAGAVKEISGLKSGFKADGTPFQHLKEVRESLSGMGKQIDALKKQIKDGAFEGDALKAAQGILNDVSKQYNELSNTLKSAEKAAKKF